MQRLTPEQREQNLRESNRKAQKKYATKTQIFALKYYPTDIREAQRLQAYLASTGISANAYLKQLVKANLDEKDFPYPD